MAWFKKKESPAVCDCGGKCTPATTEPAVSPVSDAAIKVLGSGCAKCNQLEDAVKQALAQLGRDTAIEHVTDFAQIANYGVMSTPALVVNGKVVSYGKVLKSQEVVELLQQADAT